MLFITVTSTLIVIRSTSKPNIHADFFFLVPYRVYFRRILAYLIPLRILKGHLPSQELLHRFPVLDDLFSPFITAIRIGDVQGYDEALEKWESRLLQLNLWLSLEKARELCLRGLFRRV